VRRLLDILFGKAKGKLPKAESRLPLPVARQWLPSHQVAWHAFLGTEAGGVLFERMAAAASANAKAGAADSLSATFSAGRTTGFYDAMEWLYSQTRIEFEEEISGAGADQPATSADQSGEAELRERYSP
jgi:hypothetical protein